VPDRAPRGRSGDTGSPDGAGQPGQPGGGEWIVIPPARRSPDDHPEDYPGLRQKRRSQDPPATPNAAPTGQAVTARDAAEPDRTTPAALDALRRLGSQDGRGAPVVPTRPADQTTRLDQDPPSGRTTETRSPTSAEADLATYAEATIWAGAEDAEAADTSTTDDNAAATDTAATADRRQFHRYAGAAVMSALLAEGQIMEVSDMLAASPVQIALERADQILGQALDAHEVMPPAYILAQTARLHRGLERLGRRRIPENQWSRLRLLAGRVAVLRADAAFKIGDVAGARALTGQGYAAGLDAGDGYLCGSAREVGAVTEFYDGRPDEALRLARDGQRHVTDGPVRARLVCQEARALAGLGDVLGAARALDAAYDLADAIPPDRWGRPGPSFDTFNPVEVAYNATTALCLLGRPHAAEEHAELALPKLDGMDAPGFRSVIRLDLALALARNGRLDLERVCELSSEAIRISWGRTVASVSGRADQLLAATQPHSEVRAVRELATLVRDWQRSAVRQRPGRGAVTTAPLAVATAALETSSRSGGFGPTGPAGSAGSGAGQDRGGARTTGSTGSTGGI
jgi:hypothetical protein